MTARHTLGDPNTPDANEPKGGFMRRASGLLLPSRRKTAAQIAAAAEPSSPRRGPAKRADRFAERKSGLIVARPEEEVRAEETRIRNVEQGRVILEQRLGRQPNAGELAAVQAMGRAPNRAERRARGLRAGHRFADRAYSGGLATASQLAAMAGTATPARDRGGRGKRSGPSDPNRVKARRGVVPLPAPARRVGGNVSITVSGIPLVKTDVGFGGPPPAAGAAALAAAHHHARTNRQEA